MNSKMTTITAAEFVEKGYAAKIESGECEVKIRNGYTPVRTVKHQPTIEGEYCLEWVGYGGGYIASHTQLTVTWLPQPATASDDAPTGAGDDLLVVKYGDGYAAGYADGIKDYESQQTELASLRAQVEALAKKVKHLKQQLDLESGFVEFLQKGDDHD